MIGELVKSEISEFKSTGLENFRNIKPEKAMPANEIKTAVKDEVAKASNEMKENNVDIGRFEKNINPIHKDCLTTSEERKVFANHSKGKWEKEPGNSRFYPEKQEAKEALEKYNEDGIDYDDGEPDFSKCSEATVKIDNMTSERYGPGNNFNQADNKCAEKWNKEIKDNKSDWTARDVADWRSENKYSWHERLDMKTMDLVPSDLHSECKHFGGVSECKRHEAKNGGGFDD